MGWEPRQKDLVLILARDMAARLATPMFVVDAEGTLVFFNEAAEALLGQSFADIGEVSADHWAETFRSVEEDGTPIPRADLPLGIALMQGKPAHRSLDLIGADGVKRHLAATAIPLQRHPTQTVGAVAMFWERSSTDPAADPDSGTEGDASA
jgi:PAS domain-containing protein